MMKLHQLQSFNKKSKKRIGRGGKRGTYSGRGIKGQKARAGHRIRPAERDLILRLPKLRGFKNKPVSSKPLIFNLKDLSFKLKLLSLNNKNGVEVDKDVLKKVGIVDPDYKGEIKILGEGEVTFPLVVKGISVSRKAKEKIEKAGGKVLP